MPALLTGSAIIRPFASTFAGSITADGQTARVAALAVTAQARVALLSLVASETTVSAVAARLFKGEQLPFAVAEEAAWTGSVLLGRLDAVSYRQIKAAVPHTREKNYLIIPHTADIGEGIARPDAIETAPETAAAAGAPARPPRFLLANHDEAVPNARAFLGHLRALRVVFLPHWADRLWAEGLAAGLVTPLPALGVAAWQLTSDQQRWQQLVSDAVRARRLSRHAFAVAA